MKFLSIFILSIILISCGGETNDSSEFTPSESNSEFAAGKEVYLQNCVACHQTNGQGVEGAFPPLANSDYLFADKKRAIGIAANGMEGEIVVNGVIYNSVMASQGLSKKEVFDVVNYILNAWGNSEGTVTMEEVEAVLN